MRFSARFLKTLAIFLFAGFLSFGTLLAPAHAETAPAVTATQGLKSLNMEPQAQQEDLWCWAGASTVVANYYGANVSQNEFCNRAKGRADLTSPCPNTTGDIYDVRRAWNSLGIYGSTTNYRTLTFSEIKREIDAGRPVQVRIQWKSNGMGHFLVIEGYNEATREIQWIDPWPTSKRVNVGKYTDFLYDSRYHWTHSITNIGIHGTPKDALRIY